MSKPGITPRFVAVEGISGEQAAVGTTGGGGIDAELWFPVPRAGVHTQ